MKKRRFYWGCSKNKTKEETIDTHKTKIKAVKLTKKVNPVSKIFRFDFCLLLHNSSCKFCGKKRNKQHSIFYNDGNYLYDYSIQYLWCLIG